ncbi:hypothetical protein IWZ00DRAFT_43982 [Phyllosticta capitalensis]|uniref:Uncharacterized protein n=1 Tax=Phyllosticta capitalensis TaxID=121624 RepID=A0ABR1Z5E6_9PEZI
MVDFEPSRRLLSSRLFSTGLGMSSARVIVVVASRNRHGRRECLLFNLLPSQLNMVEPRGINLLSCSSSYPLHQPASKRTNKRTNWKPRQWLHHHPSLSLAINLPFALLSLSQIRHPRELEKTSFRRATHPPTCRSSPSKPRKRSAGEKAREWLLSTPNNDKPCHASRYHVCAAHKKAWKCSTMRAKSTWTLTDGPKSRWIWIKEARSSIRYGFCGQAGWVGRSEYISTTTICSLQKKMSLSLERTGFPLLHRTCMSGCLGMWMFSSCAKRRWQARLPM